MLKILELFGGIGACSKALERLGIEYKIADYVEIDKYAVASYNAMHDTNFEPQDICEWDKDIEVDLIMHGSPCQDFSIGGKQAGGDEGSGTRSSLMYETLRIVYKLRPKYVIWENVKNLLSKKHRHNFDSYLQIMEKLGYVNYYQILNAKDYGIPQNRERVFTISIRADVIFYDDIHFQFPKVQELKLKLKDILEDNVDEKYYLSEKALNYILDINDVQVGTKWEGSTSKGSINKRIAMTIGCRSAANQRAGITNYVVDNEDREITVKEAKLIIKGDNKNNLKIRKLTPKECWRLMGFDDSDFDKASKVNSNTQLYKQAGNSIVVNVLETILYNLLVEPSTKNENIIEGQTSIFDFINE